MSKDNRGFSRALITGITGSGGSYLAEYIANNHPTCEIMGLARWHSTTGNDNLKDVERSVTTIECDLTDLSSVIRCLSAVKPDVIFHLASHANVKVGFINPLAVLNNNIMGTANLLEAVRLTEIDPVIQLCSTSEVYGQVDPGDVPITEACPLNPSSPYAVSKTTQDQLGYTYWRAYQLKVVRTRMFAYFNPRRTDLFATSFARQIALIEQGKLQTLRHGNLNSVRTLIDVRDAMAAYWDAACFGKHGEVYNIGGPTVVSVGEMLSLLKQKSKVDIRSEEDPSLLRPADVTLQIPDITKFQTDTGWKAQYSFEDSVEYLLNYWRARV